LELTTKTIEQMTQEIAINIKFCVYKVFKQIVKDELNSSLQRKGALYYLKNKAKNITMLSNKDAHLAVKLLSKNSRSWAYSLMSYKTIKYLANNNLIYVHDVNSFKLEFLKKETVKYKTL